MVPPEGTCAQPYRHGQCCVVKRAVRRAGSGVWQDQCMTERETPSVDGLIIGILGGTGDQGRGLAFRFAQAGHQVIIGSRTAEPGSSIAEVIGHRVQAMATRDAALAADVVIAAMPYEGHRDLLASLATELTGK